VWETTDPDGRLVTLTQLSWRHIVERHPELGVGRDVVLAAVAVPDERLMGREVGEEWFYRRGAGPSRWMRVVVHYERGSGRILTAFPRRSLP